MIVKTISQMTHRERESLLRDLEVEHRVAIVEAAKIKRERNRLNAELAAKEQRIQQIEDGIGILRA
ncbi:hypothetical protein PBI_SHEAKEIRA_33 [Mycobacterium phage SheaKeira]|nr:hypothetical protein PBI_SHEAKEIRA_33 [Mycobacterium phage SheaKeira]